jgi:hypothetical protein
LPQVVLQIGHWLLAALNAKHCEDRAMVSVGSPKCLICSAGLVGVIEWLSIHPGKGEMLNRLVDGSRAAQVVHHYRVTSYVCPVLLGVCSDRPREGKTLV